MPLRPKHVGIRDNHLLAGLNAGVMWMVPAGRVSRADDEGSQEEKDKG
jgi:hypothetical protein